MEMSQRSKVFLMMKWLLIASTAAHGFGIDAIAVVTIPCDMNMTNVTTTIESNTNYLITNCTLNNLPPPAGGGWMPPIHRFQVILSTVTPPSSLMNVRIMVQGGNVLPIIKIWPAVGVAGPVSTSLSVINVSVELAGITVVWPATIATSIIDSIFSLSYVYISNVSLTIHECDWNLNYPSSLLTSNNPILLHIYAPLFLVANDGIVVASPPGNVRVVVSHSLIHVVCAVPNTPSNFVVVEVVSLGSVSGIFVEISQQSVVSLSVPIWQFHQDSSFCTYRPVDATATQFDVSNISIVVSNQSSISITGTLPVESASPTNLTDVTLLLIMATRCSYVYVDVVGGSQLNFTLTRATIAPSMTFGISILRFRASVMVIDVEILSHVTARFSNVSVLLRSAVKAYACALGASITFGINVIVNNAAFDSEVTQGFAGQQGKTAACVSIVADTVTTVGRLDNITVAMENVVLRSFIQPDGGTSASTSAVLLACPGNITYVTLTLVNVHLYSSVSGATLTPTIASLFGSILIFLLGTSLLSLNGNTTFFTASITASRLEANCTYAVPSALATQFTASSVAIIYAPSAMSSGRMTVEQSSIIITNIDRGFGATPPLSTASTTSSGSWNGNFVTLVGTFSQTAAYSVLSLLIVATVYGNQSINEPSIFDGVTAVLSDNSMTVTSAGDETTQLSLMNIVVAALGLTSSTVQNGTSIVVRNWSMQVVRGTTTSSTSSSSLSMTGSSFAPIVSIMGNCAFATNTTMSVQTATGIVGPIVGGYAFAQSPAMLTLHSNASLRFMDVSAVGLLSEGSLFGKSSASAATSTFTINIMTTTPSSVSDTTKSATATTGVMLSTSSLNGFGYLAGVDSSAIMSPSTARFGSLQCNMWSPLPLQVLLAHSNSRLPFASIDMAKPGDTDWDESCLFLPNVSTTLSISQTNINLGLLRGSYLPPSTRSATSVVVGSSIVAGSLFGGTYGAVHGIQASILILQAQTLCAQEEEQRTSSSSSAGLIITPEDLCCDLGTSPTQLTLPNFGGVYLGGAVGNIAIVAASTGLRFTVGRLLQLLPTRKHKQKFIDRVLRYLRLLAPPSGPVTLSWTPYMFLLCPTVSLCVALASDEDVPAYARWVGGVILPLLLVPWAGAFAGLCWWGERVEFAFRGEAAAASSVGGESNKKTERLTSKLHRTWCLSAAHAWLLVVTEELNPRRGAKHRRLATEQLRRFGSVFASYRAARYWCFNVEVGFAIATGVATGLMLQQMSSTDPCAGAGWAWAVVGVGIVETTTALVLRAFALRLELVVFVGVMVFTILSEIVALLNPNAVDAANGLSIAAAALQIFSVLYGEFEHLLLRHRVTRFAVAAAGSEASFHSGFRDLLSLSTSLSSAPAELSSNKQTTPRNTNATANHSASTNSLQMRNALEDLVQVICEKQSPNHQLIAPQTSAQPVA
ncbi:membrane-associated protein, putative [Bodo saltans]|uniref:Membrane-associated protein, putative n=1 Tax=Bodo saltans TaxID=75058 RepID=A0A0S4JIV5_BODSA|nr:membrane-associated protein, putative [Bodo saltans]|eukprot:CUG90098.1 membrane-associated protein, putative [Bodo saltans]